MKWQPGSAACLFSLSEGLIPVVAAGVPRAAGRCRHSRAIGPNRDKRPAFVRATTRHRGGVHVHQRMHEVEDRRVVREVLRHTPQFVDEPSATKAFREAA